ncbi:MAG: type II secretion system minor pseudopilin GspK, partial [Pseudomonadota bacterium]
MNRHPSQRGAALLVVLVLVASLAAVALSISTFSERTTNKVIAAQTRDQAYWALIGAERAALALLELQAQGQDGVDRPTEEWLARPFSLPVAGGSVTTRFRDRSACFNIHDLVNNSGSRLETDYEAVKRFGNLVQDLGGTTQGGELLAVAAADFMDADGNAGPGGAEDFDYSRRDVPFLTAGTYLADVSELRAVEGWTPGLMRILGPKLCLRRQGTEAGPLNLNTLTEEDAPLLANALDNRIPLGEAERLITQMPPDGYENVDEFLGLPALQTLNPPLDGQVAGRLGTEATYIELVSTIRIERMELVMTSVIEK